MRRQWFGHFGSKVENVPIKLGFIKVFISLLVLTFGAYLYAT
jgi:hypothetical protein